MKFVLQYNGLRGKDSDKNGLFVDYFYHLGDNYLSWVNDPSKATQFDSFTEARLFRSGTLKSLSSNFIIVPIDDCFDSYDKAMEIVK